jgi:penicillin-binding protein 1A
VAGVWMGYDDNTPLTGVSGGGLPTEIWQQVMMRVHEGLPNTPLPMIVPEPPVVQAPPQPQQPAQPQRVPRQDNPLGVIDRVLRDIFGG